MVGCLSGHDARLSWVRFAPVYPGDCIYEIGLLMELAVWHKNQKVLIVQKNLLFISFKSDEQLIKP